MRAMLWCMLAIVMVSMVGCGGCWHHDRPFQPWDNHHEHHDEFHHGTRNDHHR